MIPTEQFKPNWTAIGVIGGFIINTCGWFVVHILSKRRDTQKEIRTRDEAIAKRRADIEASLRLTTTEREVLRQCISPKGYERGMVWIMRVDAFGSWVRAGTHDFMDQNDSSIQARYMDAFESLLARGYFRHEDGILFHLTGAGFDRAENNA